MIRSYPILAIRKISIATLTAGIILYALSIHQATIRWIRPGKRNLSRCIIVRRRPKTS